MLKNIWIGFGRLNPICWGPNTRAQENACKKIGPVIGYIYKKTPTTRKISWQFRNLSSDLNTDSIFLGWTEESEPDRRKEISFFFFSKSVQSLKYQVLVRSTKVQCLVIELGLDLDPREEKALFKTNSAINSKKS